MYGSRAADIYVNGGAEMEKACHRPFRSISPGVTSVTRIYVIPCVR